MKTAPKYAILESKIFLGKNIYSPPSLRPLLWGGEAPHPTLQRINFRTRAPSLCLPFPLCWIRPWLRYRRGTTCQWHITLEVK